MRQNTFWFYVATLCGTSSVSWCSIWPVKKRLRKLKTLLGWLKLYTIDESNFDVLLLSISTTFLLLIFLAVGQRQAGRRYGAGIGGRVVVVVVADDDDSSGTHPHNSTPFFWLDCFLAIGYRYTSGNGDAFKSMRAATSAVTVIALLLLLGKAVVVAILAPERLLPWHHGVGLLYMCTRYSSRDSNRIRSWRPGAPLLSAVHL
jgi:hypothetical protein